MDTQNAFSQPANPSVVAYLRAAIRRMAAKLSLDPEADPQAVDRLVAEMWWSITQGAMSGPTYPADLIVRARCACSVLARGQWSEPDMPWPGHAAVLATLPAPRRRRPVEVSGSASPSQAPSLAARPEPEAPPPHAGAETRQSINSELKIKTTGNSVNLEITEEPRTKRLSDDEQNALNRHYLDQLKGQLGLLGRSVNSTAESPVLA